MTDRALMLAPSGGLGGGIERYLDSVQSALESRDVPVHRLDLLTRRSGSGRARKLDFIRRARKAVARSQTPLRVIVGHRNLAAALPMLRRLPSYAGSSVVLHGSEMWSGRSRRGCRTLQAPDVRLVAASSFTAGAAMAAGFRASVLHPGVSYDWFEKLTTARPEPHEGIEVLTVFRLSEWRYKGLETLIDALRRLNCPDMQLSVCGSGEVPADLRILLDGTAGTRLFNNLDDGALACRLASADMMVLATRTSQESGTSGEGFGLVLLEAQLAGTPVVAPAYGGSADAFQAGITGVAPGSESVVDLAWQIGRLYGDAGLRRRMGASAAEWARTRFHPYVHAGRVVETLLPDIGQT